MKYRKIIALIIILGLININGIIATASNNSADVSDVSIFTEMASTQAKQQIQGTIHIQYNNLSLYNDMVKLSYHIYDKDNNLLVFENERIPFTLVDGKADIDIAINLQGIDAVANMKNLIIRYDIVDEKNIYWYNDNTNISFQTFDIIYENTFLGRLKEVYGNVLSQQMFQLVVSIAVIIGLIFIYRKYKKSNK